LTSEPAPIRMTAAHLSRGVLVVGGGVGGLATAIALRRRGLPADVVERHERPPVVGVGLTGAGGDAAALRGRSMAALADPI
jgi:2-polyprenyl-6-methoxyphenol hydroxylase-like FAD-dependent oxidoreductase